MHKAEYSTNFLIFYPSPTLALSGAAVLSEVKRSRRMAAQTKRGFQKKFMLTAYVRFVYGLDAPHLTLRSARETLAL